MAPLRVSGSGREPWRPCFYCLLSFHSLQKSFCVHSMHAAIRIMHVWVELHGAKLTWCRSYVPSRVCEGHRVRAQVLEEGHYRVPLHPQRRLRQAWRAGACAPTWLLLERLFTSCGLRLCRSAARHRGNGCSVDKRGPQAAGLLDVDGMCIAVPPHAPCADLQVKAVEEAGCDWIHVDVMVRKPASRLYV